MAFFDNIRNVDPQAVKNAYKGVNESYSNPDVYYISENSIVELFTTNSDNQSSKMGTVTIGWKYKLLERVSRWLVWLIPSLFLVYGFFIIKKS